MPIHCLRRFSRAPDLSLSRPLDPGSPALPDQAPERHRKAEPMARSFPSSVLPGHRAVTSKKPRRAVVRRRFDPPLEFIRLSAHLLGTERAAVKLAFATRPACVCWGRADQRPSHGRLRDQITTLLFMPARRNGARRFADCERAAFTTPVTRLSARVIVL